MPLALFSRQQRKMISSKLFPFPYLVACARIVLIITSDGSCFAVAAATTKTRRSSLEAAAQKAHNEIPTLRRQEHDMWVKLQERLLEAAEPYQQNDSHHHDQQQQQQQYQREMYGQNAEYRANQYNGYQPSSYQTWDPYLAENDFGFDIREYSFKYTGCHDVGHTLQYDPAPSRYATFRLCPTDSCSAQSTWGCQSNYGEYIVPADLLLTSLIEHNQARVTGYCEYCHKCAALESYKQFFSETSMHKEYAVSYADNKFQTWCTQNGYCSGYSSSVSDSTVYKKAAQALWKEMRNGNYANNYVSQSYNSNNQGYSTTYGYGDSRQSWRLQGDSTSSYTNEQKAWQTMGSTFGTWYDETIYPGYYDSYNQFHACWGYNSASAGRFICLDESESLYWDTDIFGTVPSSWVDFMSNGYLLNEDDSCDSRYSSSCYNQYDACMEILNDQKSYEVDGNGNKILSLSDVFHCAQIKEEQMEDYALSFYEDYTFSQKQYSQYKQQSGYDNNRNNNGGYDEEFRIFVGPDCGGDRRSIKLAVYGDTYCTTKIEGITVKELLGYNPLDDSMNIFPSDCISCQPPEDEFMWYESEQEDPVLPFCSMLYQLSGKCNTKLTPGGMYNAETLYKIQDTAHFLIDTCDEIATLNRDIAKRQSLAKKWADGIRMSTKALSSASKAFLVFLTFLFAGAIVTGCLYWYMRSALEEDKDDNLKSNDIPEIPSFKYQNADNVARKNSGVRRARDDMSRCRTAPAKDRGLMI